MTQMAVYERPSSRAAHGHIHRLAFVCAFPFVEDVSFEIRLQGCVILHVCTALQALQGPRPGCGCLEIRGLSQVDKEEEHKRSYL